MRNPIIRLIVDASHKFGFAAQWNQNFEADVFILIGCSYKTIRLEKPFGGDFGFVNNFESICQKTSPSRLNTN